MDDAPKRFSFPSGSYGLMAAALFLICVGSGILLSLHYQPVQAYKSLVMILLYNPWDGFWRNLHYWSAEAFLILSIIHCWGYLRKKHFTRLQSAVWLRLVLAIPLLFFVMFTGFLLKGDEESRQALFIFRSLLDAVPVAGPWFSSSLLGEKGSLLLPYVHHIATATILLLLIIREHARRIWPGNQVFLYSLFPVLLLSLFFIPPLHDGLGNTLKGPWYFIGLQEFLQWVRQPGWLWALLLLFLFLVFYLNRAGATLGLWIRRSLLSFVSFYFILTLTGMLSTGTRNDKSLITWAGARGQLPWFSVVLKNHIPGYLPSDSLNGKESCLHCHDGFTGFAPGHDPAVIGCASCHGGNRYSLDKSMAHRGMYLVPGNWSDVSRTCGSGSCHPDILPRIDRSLMTTVSGLMAVDHWVFGEIPSPDSLMEVSQLGHGAAATHLRNLCLSCHLGVTRDKPGPVEERSRGGGCLACHLNYSSGAVDDLAMYRGGAHRGVFRQYSHPGIGKEVSDGHCFGCHSRSGRIATSFEGWAEIMEAPKGEPDTKKFRTLQDGRWFAKAGDDVHHAAGMGCTDCHSVRETMGEGQRYRHKEEAVNIQCVDCHPAGKVKILRYADADYETSRQLRLWKMDTAGPFLSVGKTGRILLGSRVRSDGNFLFFKRSSGKEVVMKRTAPVCYAGNVHQDLSCNACHTAWAPRCISCHTSFDPVKKGNDLYTGGQTRGSWTEAMDGLLTSEPTLGVVSDKGKRVIRPVVPGMILHLDQTAFRGSRHSNVQFSRLFAPLEAHTTQKKSRTCRSCHLDPLALGYGEGQLLLQKRQAAADWVFLPAYAKSREDGLPLDAWIPFLKEGSKPWATRMNVRPFSREEQIRILRVGACLSCHGDDTKFTGVLLSNYKEVLERRTSFCLLPGEATGKGPD